MVKVYYDQDADLNILKGKTIGIVGYGSQGHAQAQNLRDSGLEVIVSEVPGTENYQKAQTARFKILPAKELAAQADIIQILIPDEIQSILYKKDIESEMKKGKVLMFSHGFNIHFKQIVPPPEVDVIMVAPKSPGHLLRRMFEEGKGVPALIAIFQDASKNAKKIALAYAKGIGATRAGVLETTFKEETETDLFGEQAVLCGGLTSLVIAGFETLVAAGYQPEIAYFECLHELKLIIDLIYEGGLAKMRDSISNTAEFGDLTVGPQIIDENVRAKMKEVLKKIQNGTFAKQWIGEREAGYPLFTKLRAKAKEHLIEKVGAELRKMMVWLKK